MKEIEWDPFELPNLPIFKTKLPENVMDYLWQRIDIAKEKNDNIGHKLAGNISSSLTLEDDDDGFFVKTVLRPISKHIIDSNLASFQAELHHSAPAVTLDMNWWVNFQKQYEFNPIHTHAGILSFVIWMQIPTDFREQHKLPFCKGSNGPAASDFQFTYADILGNIKTYPIFMDKNSEGYMFIFPAHLGHSVNPFYNCDDERISIAGNILWNIA
tara:strand:+ start:3398 stop:4039 length:642 start_codon:yes stop_codon:yes gene_type:complete